jgi:hypothetical protein
MTNNSSLHITEHSFLDQNECEAIISLLNEHPQLAIDRNPKQLETFITYGRAAYLDVCLPQAEPDRNYFSIVAQSNQLLQILLEDFYEKLRVMIEELLGDPVKYEPNLLSLPGIHIFRGSGIHSAGASGVHFDVQYQKLKFPAPLDVNIPPISFTIPLINPSNGTGLQVHDVSYEDYERAYRRGYINTFDQLVQRRTSAYYPYTIGRLFLHRGLVAHCITSPDPISHSDERITIQGHGVRSEGTWILYW